MSLRQYHAYRHSGLESLGEVPEHWKTVSLRFISKRYAGGTPDKKNLSYWENGTIPWLNSGSVNQIQITEPSEFITDEAYKNSSTKWIPIGALVMALAGQGKTKGMVAQLNISATCNQSMAAIIPDLNFNPRFLFWHLQSNYENIRNMAGGEDRDGLNLELLGSIKCPVLPLSEQTAIAVYLDRETAKIDDLVSEKELLIELLKEKRQALISHVVTKGLDPNASMKDSGIEWLGKVPMHWDIKPLLEVARERQTSNDGLRENNLLSLSYGAIVRKDINSNDGLLPESFESYQIVQQGDVIIRPTDLQNDQRSLRTAIAFERGIITSAYLAIESVHIQSHFLHYLMRAYDLLKVFYSLGGGLRQSLKFADLKRLPILAPDQTEQKAIAIYLDYETSKIDSLIESCNTAIDLLKEKRSALISAVVTGKVDVRHLVEAE